MSAENSGALLFLIGGCYRICLLMMKYRFSSVSHAAGYGYISILTIGKRGTLSGIQHGPRAISAWTMTSLSRDETSKAEAGQVVNNELTACAL